MLTLLASPVRADHRPATHSAEAKKLCYCGCDSEMGAPMCAHMCELPKYEGRSWATSCHKPQVDQSKRAAPSPHMRTEPNSHDEQALLK
jgi:hypothetical protein